MTITLGRKFWLTVTSVILLFTAFIVVRNLLHAWQTWRNIKALEQEIASYRERIQTDSLLIEQLKYDDFLEEFARERYLMQRPDDEVYLLKQ